MTRATAGMAAATAEIAAMDRVEAIMPVMPEVTPIIAEEAAMVAALVVEEAVAGPIPVIERAVIIVIEPVIGDGLAHDIGTAVIRSRSRPGSIGRGAARKQNAGRQGRRQFQHFAPSRWISLK